MRGKRTQRGHVLFLIFCFAKLRDSDLDVVLPEGMSLSRARAALVGRVALESEQHGEQQQQQEKEEEEAEESGVLRARLPDGLLAELQLFDAARCAERDARALLEHWNARAPQFRAALALLKLWASRAGVLGTVFGFPNGLALAVMLSAAALPSDSSAAALVSSFFRVFGAFRWEERGVSMHAHETLAPRGKERLLIAAPSSGRSIARCATLSSRRVFAAALARGAALLADGLAPLLLQDRRRDGVPLFFEVRCFLFVLFSHPSEHSVIRTIWCWSWRRLAAPWRVWCRWCCFWKSAVCIRRRLARCWTATAQPWPCWAQTARCQLPRARSCCLPDVALSSSSVPPPPIPARRSFGFRPCKRLWQRQTPTTRTTRTSQKQKRLLRRKSILRREWKG